MCTTNVYTYVYPDGRKETSTRPTLCTHSRQGVACPSNVVFKHPAQYVGYGTQFPPTPTYTPRSNTPIYRSGDESDRSAGYQSAASSSSRRRRRSSVVYVDGSSAGIAGATLSSSPRRERIVLVDGPPTARTPPQTYAAPHTAPSSPSTPYIVNAHHRSSSSTSFNRPSRQQPVIVDERPRSMSRPRVQIEVVDPRDPTLRASSASSSKRHVRHSSTSSFESRRSSRAEELEEAAAAVRKAERQAKREERRLREEEQRQARLRERIAAANAKIANRPAVPIAPAPLKRSSTGYARTAEADLVDAVHRLDLEDAARRSNDRKREREMKKLQQAEDEAQRQRLKERMMPKRRATVGPGSRRPHVLYDDGMYRWE